MLTHKTEKLKKKTYDKLLQLWLHQVNRIPKTSTDPGQPTHALDNNDGDKYLTMEVTKLKEKASLESTLKDMVQTNRTTIKKASEEHEYNLFAKSEARDAWFMVDLKPMFVRAQKHPEDPPTTPTQSE
ncbi:hypothetical protein L6452_22594 [Arctium lappa]|uniref:Uncharacterized protein n=1 Tax=Arctium lappa TaxID=4217 RepID=A0ACB9B1Z8_ARCLA|nr:hypothetical protein L6452_22594 [Arctium lappa]